MALSKEERDFKIFEKRRIRWEETHRVINNTDHKKCSICKEYYIADYDNFYSSKTNAVDGLHPYCIECAKAKAAQWVDDNRERHNKNKNSSRARNTDSHHNYNKEFAKYFPNYSGDYYRKNPEQFVPYQDKRREKNHKLKTKEWDSCRLYFNYRCAYCGVSYEDHFEKFRTDLHKEHFDDDGANGLSNCVPSCTNCNSQKWMFDFDQWYTKNNEIYSKERKDKILQWLDKDHIQYIINKSPLK